MVPPQWYCRDHSFEPIRSGPYKLKSIHANGAVEIYHPLRKDQVYKTSVTLLEYVKNPPPENEWQKIPPLPHLRKVVREVDPLVHETRRTRLPPNEFYHLSEGLNMSLQEYAAEANFPYPKQEFLDDILKRVKHFLNEPYLEISQAEAKEIVDNLVSSVSQPQRLQQYVNSLLGRHWYFSNPSTDQS